MIPGLSVTDILAVLGYAAPLIIFAETGLMIGFFLPGDSLLFAAGALTGIGILNVNIWVLTGLFLIAAIAGNTTGYLIGRKFGRKLFNKPENRIFKQSYLATAEGFYAEHGQKAVILAQFMPILRTFNPIVAGISKMNYRKFIAFNIIGAVIWTVGFTLAGYFLFQAFGNFIDPEEIDKYILPIIALVIVLSLLPAAIHVLRDKRKRDMIVLKTKSIFSKDKKEDRKNGKGN